MAATMATAQRVKIEKLHPHVGARVTGVDIREPIDEATFERIVDAFNEHSVLVFPGQDIDDEQQIAFSGRFGPLEETSFKVVADNPYVYMLSNVDDEGEVLAADSDKRAFLDVNSRWHTDSSFRTVPAMASILSGREVPAEEAAGTAFASMRVGYETLPDARKAAIESLVGVHSYAYSIGLFGNSGVTGDEVSSLPPVRHPLVRTHPGTGERCLFVSGHIERIVGMPVEAGRALAEELIEWCTQAEYVYQHTWHRHDLVMWDNRCVLHRAVRIPTRERRIMHRTTIAGEGPVE